MYQLIYRSTYRLGRIGSPLPLLREILKVSAERNRAASITGFLLFDGTTFVQILEGEREAVFSMFERIAADERHRDVSVIEEGEIGGRVFGRWAMGGHLRAGRDAAVYERHGMTGADFSAYGSATIVALAKELAAGSGRPLDGVPPLSG